MEFTCLYCGGKQAEKRWPATRDRLGIVPGDWQFHFCSDCGAASLQPLPLESEIAAFYPPHYSFDATRAPESRRWLARAQAAALYRPILRGQARQLQRQVARRSSGRLRLLDVGCGPGLRLAELRRRGFDVEGVDFVPELASQVERELGIPVKCVAAQTLDGVFAPASFDVITAYYLLEHLISPRDFLSSCRSLLKPGGWVALQVPLVDSFQARLFRERWCGVAESPRHISVPTRPALMRLLADTGFRDIRLRPAPALECAGCFSISALPGVSHFYTSSVKVAAAAARVATGALVAAAALPFSLAENHAFARPAVGICYARRPTEGART